MSRSLRCQGHPAISNGGDGEFSGKGLTRRGLLEGVCLAFAGNPYTPGPRGQLSISWADPVHFLGRKDRSQFIAPQHAASSAMVPPGLWRDEKEESGRRPTFGR